MKIFKDIEHMYEKKTIQSKWEISGSEHSSTFEQKVWLFN